MDSQELTLREASHRRVFLSYGRRDTSELAARIKVDLEKKGYEVWIDTSAIRSGQDWQERIVDGLRSTQVVVAVLSPHAVRASKSPSDDDSVCLDELAFARFAQPPTPIVPVMGAPCEPPFCIFRLDYVDMVAWRESEERYQRGIARLVESIELAQQGTFRYRSWESRLQPWDFTSYLNSRRQNLCGREWLFDDLDVWRKAPGERALIITGDPGAGKTAIVAELIHRNPGNQVLGFHCCIADTPKTLDPGVFVRSLVAMIASKLEAYAAILGDPTVLSALDEAMTSEDPESAFERGILSPLEGVHAPADGVRYILVDGLDEALALIQRKAGPTIVDVLASRIERLPAWLRLVVTSRKEAEVLERFSRLRVRMLDSQDPRNLDDIRRFVALRLEEPALGARLATSGITTQAASEILLRKCEGNFLYVQQALEGIERDTSGFDELKTLPPGLSGLYRAFFTRIYPEEVRFAAARSILQLLVASPEALTDALLSSATGMDSESELPKALLGLTQFVRHGEGGYALYHKSLADWLAHPDRRGSLYYASETRGHERLAEVGWSEYTDGVPFMSLYFLKNLPRHLTGARQWDRLATLLEDLCYLEAKTRAGLVYDLADDFSMAVDYCPKDHAHSRILELLEVALVRDIDFIARHREDYPQALFQCLWNSCWWYDCPVASLHYSAEIDEPAESLPWNETGSSRLYLLLESWRGLREAQFPGFGWLRALRPPPFNLDSPHRLTLRGHSDHVRHAIFSQDGERIISVCSYSVRTWNARNGRELECLEIGYSGPSAFEISPDERSLARARPGLLEILDLPTGVVRHRLKLVRDWSKDRFVSVEFSSDGRRLFYGSDRVFVGVWDCFSGELLSQARSNTHDQRIAATDLERVFQTLGHRQQRWRRSESRISELLSPSGAFLATFVSVQGVGRRMDIHNTEKGEFIVRLPPVYASEMATSFSPDEARLLSATALGHSVVHVWDLDSGGKVRVLRDSEHRVRDMSFSPQGAILATCSEDGVRHWDLVSGLPMEQKIPGSALACSFSPDGTRLLVGHSNGRTDVWDVDTFESTRIVEKHEGVVIKTGFTYPDVNPALGIELRPEDQKHNGEITAMRVWDADTGDLVEARECTTAEFLTRCGLDSITPSSEVSQDKREQFETAFEEFAPHGTLWLPDLFYMVAVRTNPSYVATGTGTHLSLYAVEGSTNLVERNRSTGP